LGGVGMLGLGLLRWKLMSPSFAKQLPSCRDVHRCVYFGCCCCRDVHRCVYSGCYCSRDLVPTFAMSRSMVFNDNDNTPIFRQLKLETAEEFEWRTALAGVRVENCFGRSSSGELLWQEFEWRIALAGVRGDAFPSYYPPLQAIAINPFTATPTLHTWRMPSLSEEVPSGLPRTRRTSPSLRPPAHSGHRQRHVQTPPSTSKA
jgi:hypothetical protein